MTAAGPWGVFAVAGAAVFPVCRLRALAWGGAVSNAVRQLGGVIGTAAAVALIGQAGTPLAGFQTAFVRIAGCRLLTALIAMALPARAGLPLDVPAVVPKRSLIGE